jgi:N-acetylmuramic acid 6-phosphate etherase
VSDSTGEKLPTLDELPTEAWDPAAADLDLRSTQELVELMNAADETVPAAVARAAGAIAAAVDAVADRLLQGGRLVYVGAGTSGRLAAVDAAECQSTFSTSDGQVVALLAGGPLANAVAQEAAEDDAAAGAAELARIDVGPLDAVVGVTASGRTPYVLGAIREASARGATTIGLVCVEGSELAGDVDQLIAVVVGPEFVSGSTRLKAGTAQKLVLNMLSTIAMIRIGKTFGNLMVDVDATNEKLHARVRRIVGQATGASPADVDRALDEADGEAKVAIVALLAESDASTARARLEAAGGAIRQALEL